MKKLFVLFLITIITLLIAKSASVMLGWNASTDPTVIGYNIYYGGKSGNYTNVVNAGNVTNLVIFGLVPSWTYFFAATAYNNSDVESPFSDEVSYTVPSTNLPVIITCIKSGNNLNITIPITGVWTLWASTDLINWNFYIQGTNTSTISIPMVLSHQFFKASY